MKREILFRGKRIDTEEWVHGFLMIEKSGTCRIYQHQSYELESLTYFFVNPETVGQFTGLTDKNGTKIFEGDKDQYGGIVEYDSLARFCINYGHSVSLTYTETTFHITGNIHDNPINP